MLTDPMLLRPTGTTVRVVWFTESPGERHGVELDGRFVPARTSMLSRTAEDADSRVPGRAWPEYTARPIWRHDALVDDLTPGRAATVSSDQRRGHVGRVHSRAGAHVRRRAADPAHERSPAAANDRG